MHGAKMTPKKETRRFEAKFQRAFGDKKYHFKGKFSGGEIP